MPPRLHLYLSPHLDDAVFSCGGLIHRQTSAGDRVAVVTVCAGDPPAGPISPYAAGLHTRWGMPAGADDRPGEPGAGDAPRIMVARRRAEDVAALAVLGAEAVHLDVPDVIYRRGDGGDWVVGSDADLFAGFNPAEGALVDRLAAELLQAKVDRIHQSRPPLPSGGGQPCARGNIPQTTTAPTRARQEGAGTRAADAHLSATVYIPLAVGDHVDHHLVRRAAERWAAWHRARPPVEGGHGTARPLGVRFVYYEDYPYSEHDDAVAHAVTGGRSTGGLATTDPSTSGPSTPAWRAIVVALDAADIDAKIAAVAAYASQLSSFWRDRDAMASAIRAFARRRARGHGRGLDGGAERLWAAGPGGEAPSGLAASGLGSALSR